MTDVTLRAHYITTVRKTSTAYKIFDQQHLTRQETAVLVHEAMCDYQWVICDAVEFLAGARTTTTTIQQK